MAWSGSEKFTPKYVQTKPKEEKKQVSSFYDDFQTRRAENSKSIGEKNPVAKTVSKSKTSNSKKSATTSHTEPKSDLKFYGGYQSYADRKKNGRVFTPSTVLGRKMSERNNASLFSSTWLDDIAKTQKDEREKLRTWKELKDSSTANKAETVKNAFYNDFMYRSGQTDIESISRPKFSNIWQYRSEDIRLTGMGNTTKYELSKDLNDKMLGLYDKYRNVLDTTSGRMQEMALDKLQADNVGIISDFEKQSGVKFNFTHLGEAYKRGVQRAEQNKRDNQYWRKLNNYYNAMYADDFSEYSAEPQEGSKLQKGLDGIIKFQPDELDPDREYASYVDPNTLERVPYLRTVDSQFNDKYIYLSDDEKRLYNLLNEKLGSGYANDYLDRMDMVLNKRKTEAESKYQEEMANEHKIIGTAGKIVSGTVGGVMSAADSGVQALGEKYRHISGKEYQPYNPYTDANALTHTANALTSGVTRDMGKVGKFLYNGVTGVAENAIRVGLLGGASVPVVGISSAGSEAVHRGVQGETDAGKVFLSGAVRGTIEAATEKIGFDHLMKLLKSPVSVAGVLMQAGIEAGEETVANLAGNIADKRINGDMSDIEMYKRELMLQGMTREEASKKAALQYYVFDTLEAAGQGFLSGAIMGGGVTTANYVNDTIETGRTINDSGGGQAVVNAGLKRHEATDANKYAQKMRAKQENGENISNWNAGRQFQKNVQAFKAEGSLADSIREQLGIDVKESLFLADSKGNALNGRYDGNNRIDISKNGDASAPATLGHEVLHYLRNNAPDVYKQMKSYVSEMILNDEDNGFKERYKHHRKNYKYSPDVAIEEVVADLAESMFGKKSSIDSMVKNNPKMVQSVLDGIKSTKAKIKDKFLAPNTNRTGLKQTYAQLDKFERMYYDGLRTASQNRGNVVSGDSRNLAIKTNSKGKYVQADRQVINSQNPDDWETEIYDYINDKIRNGQDVVIPTDDGDELIISEKTAWKMGYRNDVNNGNGTYRPMTDKEYKTKINAAAHIDELVQISKRGNKIVPDKKNHDFAKNGFNYRTAYFRDFDGQYYQLKISVGLNQNNKLTYNIGKINKSPFPAFSGSKTSGKATAAKRNSYTNIISNPDKNVKTSGRSSLAGEHAQTANFEELQKAMAMDEKGIDAEIIWQETGWGKGQDGLWRFEIDNSEAEYIAPEFEKKWAVFKLSEVLKHDKLYEAYPELKNISVGIASSEAGLIDGNGHYIPATNTIYIDKDLSDVEKRKTLLHEIQHAIQIIENFAVGADYYEDGDENYSKSAGELEARDVKIRADMTAEERRNIFPESMKPKEGLDVVQWQDHPLYKSIQEGKAKNKRGAKMDDAGVRFSVAEGAGNTYTSNKAAQQKVQDLMREQGVSSPSELSPDTVTREQSKKDRNIFRGRQGIRNFMSRAYTLVVDDMHPFWNYNKAYEKTSSQTNYGKENPYKLAINAKDASSRSAYIVSDKMVDFDNNEVGEGLVNTITNGGITEKNYNDFNNYLVARHALEWLDPDEHGSFKNVYENPALNDVDVVSAMVADFEHKNPEFKQAAESLYEWQRQLMKTWLVDTGVITQEQYDRFTEMYPDYVPFFREQNVQMSRNATGGFANQGNPFKQAVGTQERRILQPIENIMYNVASYVNHATKHAVTSSAVRLYDILESDPENNVLRQYWEEVEPVNPDDGKPQYFRTKDSDSVDIQDVTQEEENSISQTLREQMGVQDGVVTIIDNGRRRYFRVNDADFLTVLDNIKPGKLDGVFGLMASFARTRAALITSWNPAFSLASNPMRDFGTLITNSSDANKAKVAKEAVKSYIDVAKSSEAYKQYLSMGGQYSSVTTEGMDAMKLAMQKLKAKDPNIAKKFFKLFPKMFNGYQTISDAIESAPRMSEFKTTLDKGYDFHEAFFRAKDVTTNFSRGGKIAKELNAASNFFNASIQGVDKFFRQAKNNPKSFAIGVSCLAAIELLAWAWNTAGDDEEKEEAYDNLSNYTKNNNYNFYIGGGEFISIPKARESAVLGTSISATLDTLVNEQDDRFKDFFSDYVLSQFIPDGSIIGLSTVQDLRANKDYLGRPIVSAELEKLPAELQYDDDTSYFAKWLGGVIKQSPKQIDHIINSEAGVLGKVNRTYFSPSGQQDKATMFTFGVNTTFNKDSLFSTDHPTFFYNNKEEAEKQANGYPSADNGYLSNRYYQAGSVMGILNEIYKENTESDAGREMRRAYVNYAKEYKKNPMGLSDDVYSEIKDLYDANADALKMPTVQRELKMKIGKENKSFVFSDAESVINYQKDLNKGVDEAYRKLLSDVSYNAMSDLEKAEALNDARTDATKAVKKFYIENEGKKRMYADDGSTSITEPSKADIDQYRQKMEYQEEVTGYLQTIADNVAKAVPDKADDYSVSSMQINDVRSVKIDGKSYSISGDVEKKVIETANDVHYSNIEKLMNNEINVEDVVGYTSKGRARTSTQADGTKVQLTGKLYNDDGTPRFDEVVMARIMYQSKETAKDKAVEQYKDEITGSATPTFTPTPTSNTSSTKVSSNTASSGEHRRFTSAKASGGSSSKATTQTGNKVRFTGRANTTPTRRTQTASAHLPNVVTPKAVNTDIMQQAVNSFMKNAEIKPIQPLKNPLTM